MNNKEKDVLSILKKLVKSPSINNFLCDAISYFEDKFIHDRANELGFTSGTINRVFINRFGWKNNHKSIAKIAEEMNITESSFKKHLTQIYRVVQNKGINLDDENRDKFELVYEWLWSNQFYEWFCTKGYSLIERRQKERRQNLSGIDRRQPKNIRIRLIKGFQIACIKSKFNYLDDPLQVKLQSLGYCSELREVLTSSIKNYKFLDKEGNLCNEVQVIERAISIARRSQEDKSLRFILDEIRDQICCNYEVVTDQRQNIDSRRGDVVPFVRVRAAS